MDYVIVSAAVRVFPNLVDIQTQGLEVVVPCEARTAGAMIYYPMSLLIAVGV